MEKLELAHRPKKDIDPNISEAKIKFVKVHNAGTTIPCSNVQYCRAFVEMVWLKPFRFDKRFPLLQDYSTINSMDAKAPVILGSKNSF